MQIKKTVGLPYKDGERKSYTIHTKCGELFFACAVGHSGYECGGINFDTLRGVKFHIEAGGFDKDVDEPTETPTAEGVDTWDCVHPCALLIQSLDPKWPTPKNCLKTLDNYGWLDVVGRPDVARAEREIKRVQNLNKGN